MIPLTLIIGFILYTFGDVQEFNSVGARIASYNYSALGVYSCTDIKCFDRANVVIMSYIDYYAIVNFGTASVKLRQTELELAFPNNYLTNLQNSHYSNIYFAFCANYSRVLSNRMIVLKEDQLNADFGYLDFSTTIYGACTNQLII